MLNCVSDAKSKNQMEAVTLSANLQSCLSELKRRKTLLHMVQKRGESSTYCAEGTLWSKCDTCSHNQSPLRFWQLMHIAAILTKTLGQLRNKVCFIWDVNVAAKEGKFFDSFNSRSAAVHLAFGALHDCLCRLLFILTRSFKQVVILVV